MFYSDELSRLKPLFWVLLACIGFWTLTVSQSPRWAFIILATLTGVGLSLAFGEFISRRTRRRRQDHEIMETCRREKFQDDLDGQITGRKK